MSPTFTVPHEISRELVRIVPLALKAYRATSLAKYYQYLLTDRLDSRPHTPIPPWTCHIRQHGDLGVGSRDTMTYLALFNNFIGWEINSTTLLNILRKLTLGNGCVPALLRLVTPPVLCQSIVSCKHVKSARVSRMVRYFPWAVVTISNLKHLISSVAYQTPKISKAGHAASELDRYLKEGGSLPCVAKNIDFMKLSVRLPIDAACIKVRWKV